MKNTMIALCLLCGIASASDVNPKIDIIGTTYWLNLLNQDQRVYFAIRVAGLSYHSEQFDRWAREWIEDKDRTQESATKCGGKAWQDGEDGNWIGKRPQLVALWAVHAAEAMAMSLDPSYKRINTPDNIRILSGEVWKWTVETLRWTRDNRPEIGSNEIARILHDAAKWKP